MLRRFLSGPVLVALLILGTTACRGPEATRAVASSEDTTTSDLEALYWARQDRARADFTAADVRFTDPCKSI